MGAASAGFAEKIIRWQCEHGRHDLPWQGARDPYRIWVSEIMLQQTQVAAVIGYFGRFMNRFPDVATLARAGEEEVLRLWSGLGYYARARNLHRAARVIVDTHKGHFPSNAADLEKLPGIGRSTAAAIAAFSFGERVAILDGNVKRVLARHFGVEGFPGAGKVEKALWQLAIDLLPKGRSVQMEAYTQGVMDLGATICTRTNPRCSICPVGKACVARVTGRTAELPAARPRKDYPTRQATWLVLQHRRTVLLERRPSRGLWGGLWVFPESAGGSLAGLGRSIFGCAVTDRQTLPTFEHGFTHFRLRISPMLCIVEKRSNRIEPAARQWMPITTAIAGAVPVPVRKVLRSL